MNLINPALSFAQYFTKYVPSKHKSLVEKCLMQLYKSIESGHVCWDISDSAQLEEAGVSMADLAVLPELPLFGNSAAITPFIIDNNKIYLQRFFNYETQLLQNIWRLIENEPKQNPTDLVTALHHLFPAKNLQMAASLTALLHQFAIITGGPGTGKTTSVAKLLTLLYGQNPELRVMLAAPTGKAAVRLAESLRNIEFGFKRESIQVAQDILEKIKSLKPTTIHTLLGYKHNSIYFKHNRENPLPADVLIVDECSMIDIALFAKLTNAVGPNTKLVLLGDKNQLASVEAGSVFGDLCNSVGTTNYLSAHQDALMKHFGISATFPQPTENESLLSDHIIELKESHRFSDDEGIGRFSKALINGDEKTAATFYDNKDVKVQLHEEWGTNLVKQFAAYYSSYLKASDIFTALMSINDAKILCAFREGKSGVNAMNVEVEAELEALGMIKPKGLFYEHKMIMVNKNQPELGIFNGDIGIIRFIEGELRVCFLDANQQLLTIAPSNIQGYETAYAITIHKSQGSEFKKVLVIMPSAESTTMITRELLYTAVTRAREEATIVVGKDALTHIIQQKVRRISGILERINAKEILLAHH